MRRTTASLLLASGLLALMVILALLRFAAVTDYLYHGLVKDPERVAPEGPVECSLAKLAKSAPLRNASMIACA